MSVVVKSIEQGSQAEKAGISPLDTLLSINGNDIVDVLDYRFYQIGTKLEVRVQKVDGAVVDYAIKKHEYEEIGMEFETYLMDKQHHCCNKCIFCFVDQLPSDMRETLYFKDDDSRLSFLFGNYVSLTNLTEHEIDRIIKMHISPINVSVHTTNPELRCKMLNNRFAGKALDVMKRFADAGIKLNCQVVSCRGINDGKELERTITDLEKLYPAVECVAIVPVGLTKYREGLYPLESYDKQSALETLELINSYGKKFLEKYGERIVYAADEFFIYADLPIPDAEYYGDFGQLDNGVGLIALMREEFTDALEYGGYELNRDRKITCAGGVAVAPYMRKLYDMCEDKYSNIKIQHIPIVNNFFGEKINVSGLITGQDLIAQLKPYDLGEELLIPSVMLRHEQDKFLDDITLIQAEEELNVKITPVENDGEQLLKAILGIR
ncbi:MAG: DUF512 domain-containing protein [Clostridia bacterium]|nr:DUF512 domain-containing protein [Clostridia bacterium]